MKDGVLVKSVGKDSAAEKAGIKVGDVIVKIDDSKVSSTREITGVLRSMRTKTGVTVTVVRNKRGNAHYRDHRCRQHWRRITGHRCWGDCGHLSRRSW